MNSIDIKQFKKDIESGKIKVDFGKAWLDLKNPMEYLLDEIDRAEEASKNHWDYVDKKGDASFKEISYKIGEPGKFRIDEDGTMRASGFETIRMHSWITSKEYWFHLEGDTLSFKDRDFSTSPSKIIDIQIPDDIEEPTKFTIPIESKRICFVNYFGDDVNPGPEEGRYTTYTLNSILGRKNTTQFLAENNKVGYGQMGNMSIGIYTNDEEIIICDSSLDEIEEMYDYEENAEEYDKLTSYLKEKNFKYKGEISLSVWRWECADYDRVKDSQKVKGREANSKQYYSDVIHFPIKGTSVYGEHYYDGIGESKISKMIFSHLWTK